jgi:hypothetical protein
MRGVSSAAQESRWRNPIVPRYEIVDAQTVRDDFGHDHDVLQAIELLPWVRQLCPLMPHEYAHQAKADSLAYGVVEHMLKAANPGTYRAYFRGYATPNRYWNAPDGQRYWLTKMMINRFWPDSVEPLRLVSEGAGPIPDWDGPPWAPNGIGIYEQDAHGKWWPTEAALAAGFQPCRACQNTRRSEGGGPLGWESARSTAILDG